MISSVKFAGTYQIITPPGNTKAVRALKSTENHVITSDAVDITGSYIKSLNRQVMTPIVQVSAITGDDAIKVAQDVGIAVNTASSKAKFDRAVEEFKAGGVMNACKLMNALFKWVEYHQIIGTTQEQVHLK